MSEPPSITCPKCGMTSHNTNDIAQGYCGNCHEFTFTPPNPVLPRNQAKRIILPGLWVDMEDQVHWSIPDVLKHIGRPDTPENRQAAEEAIQAIVEAVNPRTTIVKRSKPD